MHMPDRMPTKNSTVCSQRCAPLHKGRLELIFPLNLAAGVDNVGEDHGRATEHIILQLHSLENRDIVLNFYVMLPKTTFLPTKTFCPMSSLFLFLLQASRGNNAKFWYLIRFCFLRLQLQNGMNENSRSRVRQAWSAIQELSIHPLVIL